MLDLLRDYEYLKVCNWKKLLDELDKFDDIFLAGRQTIKEFEEHCMLRGATEFINLINLVKNSENGISDETAIIHWLVDNIKFLNDQYGKKKSETRQITEPWHVSMEN